MNATHQLQLHDTDKHLAAALAQHREGKHEAARTSLSRARQALLRLAQITRNPQLKQQRLTQAERLAALDETWSTVNRSTTPKPEIANEKPVPADGPFRPEMPDRSLGFEHVAGLEDAKREIRLRMILPFAHRDTARAFGVETGGGLLLYGPPGTGKTLLARATATELDAPFFSIKASDIMSKWVGEAEKNVAALFATARAHERAVLFIDEIEALVPARAGNGSTVMARVVPQFLAEMQGFHQHAGSLLVMGATNEPWAIDSAILRPGRFDVHIHVGLPDEEARRAQLARLLENRPLAMDVDRDRLAELADGLSGADIAGFVQRAAREGFAASLEGAIQPLTQALLEATLAATRPSVSTERAERYRRFALQASDSA